MAGARAWQIHATVLVTLGVLYLVTSWDGWIPADSQASDLDAFGAVILLTALSVYAFVTTLIVARLQRRPLAVLLLHALAIAGYFAAISLGAGR